jgi:predicted acylesterase/phospholipase RssA
MKQITHLVFSGNALKSICLCGVLRYIYFYNLHLNIREVSGTSMGSFFALCYALQIPIEELEQIIYRTCDNIDNSRIYPHLIMNFVNNYGFMSSHNYLIELKAYIKKVYDMDDMTFLELSKKTGINIYVSTTRVYDGSNIIFNVNDTPDISVFDAVSASMCLPIIAKPVIIDGVYYIDGFLSNNFPYEVFSNINKDNILGISVYLDEENYLNDITNMGQGDMTLFQYYLNILYILYKNTDKYTHYNKIINHPDCLIIRQSEVKSIFTPNITEDYIDLSIDRKIVDNLFLQGFKCIYDYMESHNKEIIKEPFIEEIKEIEIKEKERK